MESESRDHQHQAEVCTGTHQSDYTFKEEHVPGLAEVLARVAHKWEEIAVALRLPEAVRAECGESSSYAMKLYRVLYQWIVDQHSNAKPATRENLKTALASPLVQHPQLASELEDKLKTSLSLQTLTASQKESVFQSIFQSGVREVLVEKYSQCPEVPRGSWPPVVSKTYINFALIESSGQPLKSDYSIRGDADDVLAMKKIVEYEDMFSVYERRKKLLILGRPGSGKTTLVHKLVRDWSAGKALQGAELVFLVSLRVLRSDKCGLAQLLQKHIYSEKDVKLVINAIERARGKGVCFIFDGFDEYCPRNREESVIFALLDKSYLVDAMIIVTSRPAAASAATEIFNDSYRKIEVFGFSKSQIMEYVRLFPFSSSSSGVEAHAKKLQNFLSSHPGVLDLCYLPVNCAIICFIYDTEPDHLPDTQTQIYALFTRLIIIRQLTSRDISRQLDSLEDLEGQEAEDFKKLCSLAFDMTTHSQQVITRGPASSDETHSLGLVTTDITAGLSGYENSYSFLHLTLQEFLAAYHLSKLNQEEQMSLIEKHCGTFNMLVVWQFFFGLVSFNTGLDRAEKLFSVYKDFIDTHRFKVLCSYEAKQSSITQLASSRHFSFYSTLSNYEITALAYVLCSAAASGSLATPTRSLVFQSRGPGSDQFKILIQQLDDRALAVIECLHLSLHHYFSMKGLKIISNMLNRNRMGPMEAQGLRSLKYLRLEYSGIGDEGVAVLAVGLDGDHVLESLDLTGNSISVTGIRELMKLDCHIQDLNLSNNNIGDEGAKAVATGLRGNLTLKSISLSRNDISVAGVEALALVLQRNPLQLNLAQNKFTSHTTSPGSHSSNLSEDVRDLTVRDREVDGLPVHCNLESLDLHGNICEGDPVAVISKFSFLSYLNFSSNNKLGLQGAMAVVDYVANSDNCKQLKYLDLYAVVFENKRISASSYRECFAEHLEHKLPSSSFIVDLSWNFMDKTRAISLLQAMKNYDRVGGVYLDLDCVGADQEAGVYLDLDCVGADQEAGVYLDLDCVGADQEAGVYLDLDCVGADQEAFNDLFKAFQHDHMERLLVFKDDECYIVPARSNNSELDNTTTVPLRCCSMS